MSGPTTLLELIDIMKESGAEVLRLRFDEDGTVPTVVVIARGATVDPFIVALDALEAEWDRAKQAGEGGAE